MTYLTFFCTKKTDRTFWRVFNARPFGSVCFIFDINVRFLCIFSNCHADAHDSHYFKKVSACGGMFYAFSFSNFSMNSTSFCTPSIGIAL